jgi:hypothetical protein
MPEQWEPSGAWLMKFRQSVAAAFDDPSLILLTNDFFGPARSFYNLSPPGFGKTIEFRIYELIENARQNDWLLDLVAAVHERRPNNPALNAIAEERGLTLTGPRLDNPSGKTFEALVQAEAKFLNPTLVLERLPILQSQVCFVELPGGRGGTGFLVGTDFVLTNQHVIAPILSGSVRPQDVRCRFDYRQAIDGTALSLGMEVELSPARWLEDSRPPSDSDRGATLGDPAPDELDYAIVRLADSVGEVPVGGATADPQAKPRGWIDISADVPAVAQGNQVFMLQHPAGEPLQLSIGTVKEFNLGGTRMRHTANSKNGSSGSPCLNADLQLVALHHAHDPAFPPQWNQAIPFGLIQKRWRIHRDAEE